MNAPLRAPGGLGSTPPLAPTLPGAHWVNPGRGASARPHSVAQRGGWSDAGGVISPLHVLPSHWPSPRPSLAAPARRGHVARSRYLRSHSGDPVGLQSPDIKKSAGVAAIRNVGPGSGTATVAL